MAKRCILGMESKEERRQKVLKLNQEGISQNEIARRLHINKRTVRHDLIFLKKQGHATKIFRISNQDAKEKWNKVIIDIRDEALPYFTAQGIKPSLRTIYYRVRARNLIDNTEKDYNNLGVHTKQARLQDRGKNGLLLYPKLPIDCLSDETRKLVSNYSDYAPTEVQDPDDYIESAIDDLRQSIIDYDGAGSHGGRWYGQPEYVEVWIEKFADFPTFQKWLEDKDVNIVVNKGYTSISFLWENIVRLKEAIKRFGSKHVHVQYFGDFDPSGEDMVKSLQEYFRRFGLSSNIIKKVSLTPKQIDDYNLPSEPIKDTDKRSASFETKHGDEGAEIDAFIAYEPEALEKIVQDSVDRYFNQKIHDDMIKKYKTSTSFSELRDIHNDMIFRVQHAFQSSSWKEDLIDELEDTYEDYKEDEDEDKDDDDEDEDE